MQRHFLICILPSERPRDASLVVISALLPSIDFGDDSVAIWQSPVKHWRSRIPISISAMFSQLACFGV